MFLNHRDYLALCCISMCGHRIFLHAIMIWFQEGYVRAGAGVVYNQPTVVNGSSPVSPVTSAYSESSVTDARPHIKYVRAASSSAGSSTNQAAFLTMTSPGVLELTGLAGVNPQVLAAHHNVQFLGSSLKVLTPGKRPSFFFSKRIF